MLDYKNNLSKKIIIKEIRTLQSKIANLWHKDQSHREVTAKDICKSHKSKSCILLIRNNHGDWRSDDAQDCNIIDRHSHQSAVVNLLNL